jgi:hypothetical protein
MNVIRVRAAVGEFELLVILLVVGCCEGISFFIVGLADGFNSMFLVGKEVAFGIADGVAGGLTVDGGVVTTGRDDGFEDGAGLFLVGCAVGGFKQGSLSPQEWEKFIFNTATRTRRVIHDFVFISSIYWRRCYCQN